MTNAEKYKEVFGFPPDLDTCPTECKFCPIRQQGINCIQSIGSCGNWWNSEYKESEEE